MQDQDVTNADEVAWDGDGVGRAPTGSFAIHGAGLGVAWSTDLDFAVFDADVSFTDNLTVFAMVVVRVVLVVMVVVVRTAVDRVQDAVGGAMETVAEGVVLPVFVVISHITFLLTTVYGSLFGYSNVLVEADVTFWV